MVNYLASDFEARASLKELSKVNSIPIDISAKRNSLARKVTIEKQSVQTLIVDIEEVQKQNFDIEVEFEAVQQQDMWQVSTHCLKAV